MSLDVLTKLDLEVRVVVDCFTGNTCLGLTVCEMPCLWGNALTQKIL